MKRIFQTLGLLTLCTPLWAQPLDPEQAAAELDRLAAEARAAVADLSFEAFRDQTLFVPETGKFYVNGDVPIRNEKLLREFWEQNVRSEPAISGEGTPEFTVAFVGGLDQIWGNTDRHRLTYCVSNNFGSRHPLVVADMQIATAAWAAAADLTFTYLSAEDGDCDTDNDRVMFDVRPVDTGGEIFAAAFFPNDPRADRSVIIDPSSFDLDPNSFLTLRGILRHEVGHIVGGRHEHTRPEAGDCFEDADWRGVTDYDAFSVMHYPHCNGLGDWSLTLTAQDRSGVACLYGAAAGFAIDPAICTPPGGAGVAETTVFGPFDIEQDAMQIVMQAPVVPGTPFRVEMTGTGDPDLYVKFDGPALVSSFDCRPFIAGAAEVCAFDVPAGRSLVSVAVHGFEPGNFSVSVTATQP